MSEELQQKLRDQLWEVANKLRGKVGIVIVCEIASAYTLVGACLAVFGKLYWG